MDRRSRLKFLCISSTHPKHLKIVFDGVHPHLSQFITVFLPVDNATSLENLTKPQLLKETLFTEPKVYLPFTRVQTMDFILNYANPVRNLIQYLI